MKKGIIKRVYLQSNIGRNKRVYVSLKNRPVDIEEARIKLETKYKKKVLFVYESI